MCNNNGHCRKFDAGTMCPSYRVTRDEQHLTRGRANTLRLALSGQLGPDAFTSDAMHETLDLCVGCKGCKRDCPTGVDMAKMKIEFLAHYKARHGYTLKDRLVAHLPDYAHGGEPRAVAGEPARHAAGRGVAEREAARLVGEAHAAAAGARDTFWRVGRRVDVREPGRHDRGSGRGGKAAVLFVDTFNGTFESENALAAARVLKAAGYTLHTRRRRTAAITAAAAPIWPAAWSTRRRRGPSALIDALLPLAASGRADRRPGAVVPADAARRGAGDGLRRDAPRSSRSRRCCSRSSSRARRRPGASR